jgi:hypothetical protein
VAFVPLQYWKYKWLAIQLDGAHSEEQATDDVGRDEYVRRHNYEVISLKPNEKGYLEEVRTPVEQLESWMNLAEPFHSAPSVVDERPLSYAQTSEFKGTLKANSSRSPHFPLEQLEQAYIQLMAVPVLVFCTFSVAIKNSKRSS